ncbi:transmembrane protein 92 isoform X1 [Cavia porcellus]|uniref:transmembrane protein 92 isoform X1 n=1 Tax=Cavia porcellus TaxID=10141 RepID=UPI000C87B4D6|nr:transmembrane protein 92 isoform X1 [Cavia porcellus]
MDRLAGFSLPLLLARIWAAQVTLQRLLRSANSRSYPGGFRCCENRCCQGDEASGLFRVFLLICIFILSVLGCFSLGRHCCVNRCQTMVGPTGGHQQPQSPATFGAPPSYSEVVGKPTLSLSPTEPPPPYSLRPEGHTGTERDVNNPASDLEPPWRPPEQAGDGWDSCTVP